MVLALHIKLFIGNKKLYLNLALPQLSWDGNRREIWTVEEHFGFLFKLSIFVEDPPKEDDKEKAVEKEEG